MIEGSTMVLIYLFLGVPILIGLLGTWLTRPDKYTKSCAGFGY